MLDTHARKFVQPLLDKVAGAFIKLGFSANGVTILAFVVGLGSAFLLVFACPAVAIATLWLSGLLDAVDGTVARKTGTSSHLGTVMDIVFDRIVEIGILMAFVFINPGLAVHVAIVLCTIIVSMTIFLTVGASTSEAVRKKNTEKKSFYYQVGLTERADGFVMLSIAMFLQAHRGTVLLIFAAMILFTAVQRFVEAVKLLKE